MKDELKGMIPRAWDAPKGFKPDPKKKYCWASKNDRRQEIRHRQGYKAVELSAAGGAFTKGDKVWMEIPKRGYEKLQALKTRKKLMRSAISKDKRDEALDRIAHTLKGSGLEAPEIKQSRGK